jgi:hypothetical protein
MPGLPSPLVCKYSRALTMTGNVHLNHRVSHILVYLSRLKCPSRHRSDIILAQIYQFFRRIIEGECDFLHIVHHGPS